MNYTNIDNNKSNFDVNASQFYFDKLRPFMSNMLSYCTTDDELVRTIYKVINSADSFCVRNDWSNLNDSFEVLYNAISDKAYFDGVISKASEDEKNSIRTLISMIDDLRLIIKFDLAKSSEDNKNKNDNADNDIPVKRIDSNYDEHTKALRAFNLKQRLPNR